MGDSLYFQVKAVPMEEHTQKQDSSGEGKVEICPKCHTVKVNGECMCDFW